MATKVLVLLGSPRRKGNSAILAGQIEKGAKAVKAKVETIYLHGKTIAPAKPVSPARRKTARAVPSRTTCRTSI